MNKELRERVRLKYGGLCAYSGTPLEDDWQVDHKVSRRECNYGWGFEDRIDHVDDFDNLMPCQKILNHYKRAFSVEEFKIERMNGLHKRLYKLPLNPRTEAGINRKLYLLKIASYFGITPDKPFSGVFYFEKI